MRQRRSNRETTEGNEYKCTTFRISQFVDSSDRRPPDPSDRRPDLSRTTLKLSTKRTLAHSTRNLHRSTALLSLSKLAKLGSSDYADLIAQEIERAQRPRGRHEGAALISSIFAVSERLNQ